jgi:hypothetical protein
LEDGMSCQKEQGKVEIQEFVQCKSYVGGREKLGNKEIPREDAMLVSNKSSSSDHSTDTATARVRVAAVETSFQSARAWRTC